MEKIEKKKRYLKPIIYLVMSILTVICCPVILINLPLGILTLIFANKDVQQTGSNLDKASAIVAIVGMTLCVALYVLYISFWLIRHY